VTSGEVHGKQPGRTRQRCWPPGSSGTSPSGLRSRWGVPTTAAGQQSRRHGGRWRRATNAQRERRPSPRDSPPPGGWWHPAPAGLHACYGTWSVLSRPHRSPNMARRSMTPGPCRSPLRVRSRVGRRAFCVRRTSVLCADQRGFRRRGSGRAFWRGSRTRRQRGSAGIWRVKRRGPTFRCSPSRAPWTGTSGACPRSISRRGRGRSLGRSVRPLARQIRVQ
jgi:hypothetical protein